MKNDKNWDTLKFDISDSFNYGHYFCLKLNQIFFVLSIFRLRNLEHLQISVAWYQLASI